jgi:hypothetical protein
LNVKLSGGAATGVSGEYAYLDPDVLRPESGWVDWYMEYVHDAGGCQVVAAAKDTDVHATNYYKAFYEKAEGTIQQWTSVNVTATSNNVYRVPYPKGCIPALCVTITGATATVRISAKVAR